MCSENFEANEWKIIIMQEIIMTDFEGRPGPQPWQGMKGWNTQKKITVLASNL